MAVTGIPIAPAIGTLVDERLQMYLSLAPFWSPGIGALLISNIDPLVKLKTRTDIVKFLNALGNIKLIWLINRESNAAKHIVELWEQTTQKASHCEVPAEEFLSWAKQQNVPGIDSFWKRAYPSNNGSLVSPTLRKRIMDYQFRGEMSASIINAISKAQNPEDYHHVWEELLKLAEVKDGPLLGVNETGKIRYRNNKGTTNIYEKSSLEKSLRRAVGAAKSSHKLP